jgi:hypothetical protein
MQVIGASSLAQLDDRLGPASRKARRGRSRTCSSLLRRSLATTERGGIEILIQACLSLDRAEECAEQINEDGPLNPN